MGIAGVDGEKTIKQHWHPLILPDLAHEDACAIELIRD